MEVNLIVTNGKQMGKKLPVSSPKFLIGRGEECQLRPQSNLVSRKHCIILVEEGSAAIEDLGSTNGTFVNGEKLEQRRELKSGDRIRVGMLGLEVQLGVGAGGKKKAEIHTVQEAARTAATAAVVTQEDVDISRWLGDDDETGVTTPRKGASIGDDTMAGKSLVDTTTIPVPPSHKKEVPKKEAIKQEAPQKKEEEETKKKEPPARTVGRLHRPAKPTTESSGAAADDALRHFFHRKKP